MPKLDSPRWLKLIAGHRAYRGDLRRLAVVTGIPYGTLRNAVHGHDQMRLSRIYELADALDVPDKAVFGLLAEADRPGARRRRRTKAQGSGLAEAS